MKEVYEQLLNEICRLRGELSLEEQQQIFKEYIYDNLTDQEILEIIKTDNINSIELPNGLSKEAVLRQTLLTISLLHDSKTWEEFLKLTKQPQREPIDFDELIKTILHKPPN
jgi:hypothetical protein